MVCERESGIKSSGMVQLSSAGKRMVNSSIIARASLTSARAVERWCWTEGKGEGGTGEGDQGHRRGRAETVGDEQRLALLHEARGQRERKNVREKW